MWVFYSDPKCRGSFTSKGLYSINKINQKDVLSSAIAILSHTGKLKVELAKTVFQTGSLNYVVAFILKFLLKMC